jgi:hypothetical protein
MRSWIWLWLIPTLALLAGCSSAPKTGAHKDAAYLTYKLPATAARVTMDLTLTKCTPSVSAKAVISLAPVVVSSQHEFTIDGSKLASFSKKKEVEIGLYPNQTIKSVNSAVSDRTGAILVNAIKTVGMLAMAADERPQATDYCNEETKRHVERVDEISKLISDLRSSVSVSPKADVEANQKKIDAWAKEAARIKIENLTTSLSGDIVFDEQLQEAGGVVQWSTSRFERWFTKSEPGRSGHFMLGWCLSIVADEAPCSKGEVRMINQRAKAAAESKGKGQPQDAPRLRFKCKEDGTNCATTLVFLEPKDAMLKIFAYGSDLGVTAETEMAQVLLPVTQWGDVSYLDFSAGFGESKAASLSLDEYGRRTSFGWKSEARGEGIGGSLQGIGDAAQGFYSVMEGREVKDQKAEIEVLETQQKLNKIRLCKAAIEAGGHACPE